MRELEWFKGFYQDLCLCWKLPENFKALGAILACTLSRSGKNSVIGCCHNFYLGYGKLKVKLELSFLEKQQSFLLAM